MAEPTSAIDSAAGRRCCHCKQIKPFPEYASDKNGPAGLYRGCRLCVNKRHKLYYRKNRIKIRARTKENHKIRRNDPVYKKQEWSRILKAKYDIDAKIYAEMHNKQKGVCAVCRNPETVRSQNKVRRLSVDHNHRTNKVRKLLCDRCNRLLGVADDNVELLMKVIQYLKEN